MTLGLVVAATVLVIVIAGVAAFRAWTAHADPPPVVDWDAFMDDVDRWAAARRGPADQDDGDEPRAPDASRRDEPGSPER